MCERGALGWRRRSRLGDCLAGGVRALGSASGSATCAALGKILARLLEYEKDHCGLACVNPVAWIYCRRPRAQMSGAHEDNDRERQEDNAELIPFGQAKRCQPVTPCVAPHVLRRTLSVRCKRFTRSLMRRRRGRRQVASDASVYGASSSDRAVSCTGQAAVICKPLSPDWFGESIRSRSIRVWTWAT